MKGTLIPSVAQFIAEAGNFFCILFLKFSLRAHRILCPLCVYVCVLGGVNI